MEKIGYYEAGCSICGESYNGYGFHTCPPGIEEATKEAIESAIAWAKAFSREPDRELDARLYNAVEVYERSKAAEPAKKLRKERMADLAKKFLGAKPEKDSGAAPPTV